MTYIYHLILSRKLPNKIAHADFIDVIHNRILGVDLTNVPDASVRNNLGKVFKQFGQDL